MHLGGCHSGFVKPVCCAMPGNGLHSSDIYDFPNSSLSKFITARFSNTEKYGFDFVVHASQSPGPRVQDDRPLWWAGPEARAWALRGSRAFLLGPAAEDRLALPGLTGHRHKPTQPGGPIPDVPSWLRPSWCAFPGE